MKNITTPRTLAECSFTTGYPQTGRRARGALGVVFVLVLFAFIGALLGWGF